MLVARPFLVASALSTRKLQLVVARGLLLSMVAGPKSLTSLALVSAVAVSLAAPFDIATDFGLLQVLSAPAADRAPSLFGALACPTSSHSTRSFLSIRSWVAFL